MSVFKEGQKYNRMTLVKFIRKNKQYQSYWLCRCDCGTEKVVQASSVKNGRIKSCGCLNRELSSQRKGNFVHGFSNKERLYETWKNMKRRCYDETNNRYKDYGGKGVKVCDEWMDDYITFRNWSFENGYRDGLTIDRINVNGNYEPSNCRWANWIEQANNQTRNKLLTYQEKTMTMSQWADYLGITYGAMNHRVQRNWSMERIVSTPLKGNEIAN